MCQNKKQSYTTLQCREEESRGRTQIGKMAASGLRSALAASRQLHGLSRTNITLGSISATPLRALTTAARDSTTSIGGRDELEHVTATPGVVGEVDTRSGPGALRMGYKDDYFNHPHRYRPGDPTKRAFTYVILGTSKFIAASAARLAVLKALYTMSASADVLARGSVEVDLSAIPMGESATIKWRGKPVFIRHRTQDDIKMAQKDDRVSLRDAEMDADRCQKPEWLVVLGVCTHLGCVPVANAGDYHGWFCPCHGSHYDVSGRIRKGPAPLNLEVPQYRFVEEDTKLILG